MEQGTSIRNMESIFRKYLRIIAVAMFGFLRESSLRERMKDKVFVLDVSLNGKNVGVLMDAWHARMQWNVFGSGDIAMAQLLVFAQMAGRIIWLCLRVVPLLFFWLFMLGVFYGPSEFVHMLRSFGTLERDGMIEALVNMLMITEVLFALLASFLVLFGRNFNFGYRNVYRDSMCLMILKECNIDIDSKETQENFMKDTNSLILSRRKVEGLSAIWENN